MDSSSQEEENKKITEVKTYPIQFSLDENQENLTINTNTSSKNSKEQIINQAFRFHSHGNISEAAKYYQDFINKGYKDYRVLSNYGTILTSLGKLKEAEKYLLEAIELNPDSAKSYFCLGVLYRESFQKQNAENALRKAVKLDCNCDSLMAYFGSFLFSEGNHIESIKYYRRAIEINPNKAKYYHNLSSVIVELGDLKEAEKLNQKAHKLSPFFSRPYCSLSNLKTSKNIDYWNKDLFSEDILSKNDLNSQFDIHFSRATTLHKQEKYVESAKQLVFVNELKLKYMPSNIDSYFSRENKLKILIDLSHEPNIKSPNNSELIFIFGIPGSGSTLVESIITMKSKDPIQDELIFNKMLQDWLDNLSKGNKNSFYDVIYNNILKTKGNGERTIIKVSDFSFLGLILNHFPTAKIVACKRYILDNVLTLYQTYFTTGWNLTSSLNDTKDYYLSQNKILEEFKLLYSSRIYCLNYESLVYEPKSMIKSLISWLNFEWDKIYLSPHLNKRILRGYSCILPRYPITKEHVGVWEKYQKMLSPIIDSISQ